MFGSDGPDSGAREQGDGNSVGEVVAGGRDYRMEKAASAALQKSAISGQRSTTDGEDHPDGFHLSPSAGRGVRGWLFLARLSEALQPVEVDQEKYDEGRMGERKQETGDRSQKTEDCGQGVGAADREKVLAGEAGR